jgi:acetyl esterase
MAIDPAFRTFLDAPGTQLLPPPPGVTAAMMRAAALPLVPGPPPLALFSVREVMVRGVPGELSVRLYHPFNRPSLPLIVYFHGGGFVFGDLDGHDPTCRALAHASGCVVASVAYRLAPETRFPGPLEDCYAALSFLAQQGDRLNCDTTRIAVAGDSAGGNLAAAVTLLARDRKGPELRYQALLYPVTDAACDTQSFHDLAQGYLLSRDMMRWFWECYLDKPGDADNPLASPLRAANLAGLPPATVVTAEYDPLRDEGEAYAARLISAGVAVVSRRYLGMIHGFASMPSITPVAARAMHDIAGDLRAALVS